MEYSYKTKGTCSTKVTFDIENNVVKNVEFFNGCSGNGKGITSLVEGMKVDDIIQRLEGINCGGRATSCPDQLAKALIEVREKNNI